MDVSTALAVLLVDPSQACVELQSGPYRKSPHGCCQWANFRRVRLKDAAGQTVARFLADYGVADADIDRGLHYAELKGARTIREGFVLAMSRVTLSDEELAAGTRFNFEEET